MLIMVRNNILIYSTQCNTNIFYHLRIFNFKKNTNNLKIIFLNIIFLKIIGKIIFLN